MMPFRLALLAQACVLIAAVACGDDDGPSTRAANERIFLVDGQAVYEVSSAPGSDRTAVAKPPDNGFIFDASISREGDQIAMSVQTAPVQSASGYDFGIDLFAGRLGGEPSLLTAHEGIGASITRPNWLPGGKEIIAGVVSRGPSGALDTHVERIDTTTGAQTRLLDNASEPSVSPDGRMLAFLAVEPTGKEVITIMDLSTGVTRPLLPTNQVMSNVGNIVWSPDGSRVAFAAADPIALTLPPAGAPLMAVHPTLRDVWLVGVDGSGLKRRTELADGTLALAWSLDGATIYALGDTGFWRLGADAGEPVKIGEPVLTGRVQVLPPK